jgi:alpha-glucosidase
MGEEGGSEHDLNIVFTRGLAGSTDYHLGGFRAVPDSLFKVQYTRPLMLGTRCHMLAMYIVLESALQMLCDYPAAYENQPGFSILREIPTTWDETRVIDAKPGKFACIARRKGSDWYIGAINNNESREINIPCQVLGESQWSADIYADVTNASAQPDLIQVNRRDLKSTDLLKIQLTAGGGALILLKKK